MSAAYQVCALTIWEFEMEKWKKRAQKYALKIFNIEQECAAPCA